MTCTVVSKAIWHGCDGFGYNSVLRTKIAGGRRIGPWRPVFRRIRRFEDTPTMAALDRPVARPRPVYLNLIAIRLPLPAFVSILHRISGALLFLIGIPLLLWMVQHALASPDAWAAMRATLSTPFAKLVLLGLAWACFHHLLVGLRHLLMDLHVGTSLAAARQSSALTFVLALVLTLAFAVKLW
jgi:succinate dehydrogenase / fumarate reductase cytochrome b subunit